MASLASRTAGSACTARRLASCRKARFARHLRSIAGMLAVQLMLCNRLVPGAAAAASAACRDLNRTTGRPTIGKMLTHIAKFADIGTNGLRLQVQCLGNLPFRSAFPPQAKEHCIALGFGRR